MVISHNIGALNAQRQFNINTKNRSKTAEKLSSGYRINRASDDAAGLAISEKMRKQVRGLSQGVENTQAGVGMCQVADGALSEVTAMLQRMTELSVQAANGTNSVSDREAIQQEINEILIEIERISDTTKFNETYIFQGEETSVSEGNSIIEAGDIPFQDFALADLDLGNTPFNENSGAEYLNLKAIVNNKDSAAYGKDYSLIYGNGGTSSSSFRISLSSSPNTSSQLVFMNTLTPSNYQFDEASNVWSRDFEYEDTGVGYDVVIKQKVALEELNGGKEKNYVITYEFENKGSAPVDFEFMFQ